MEFLYFVACIVLLVFLYIKLKRRFFNRFIDAKQQRVLIWNWTKRIILLALSLCFLIKGIERWYYFHDEIAYTDEKFLDMAYADQVEIEVYLMEQAKLISLFKGNPPEPGTLQPKPKPYRRWPSPLDSYFYLVLRVKNKGDRIVWGSLSNRLNERYIPHVDIPPLPPNMTDFTNIVLWSHSTENNLPEAYPKLEVQWKRLYTSKGEDL